ncbi:MAG: 5-amino-6-(D-ribitylamino)uracil--L-tyrosine 4-hydroxyphenyl transferase CofH [Burkholderiales bacterium]|nr:5-amino-6-(D-ribitylamino)uracil--L-tyrosine 4-hydroxyphenyl transferase CofH [Burkholderiales bacterium]
MDERVLCNLAAAGAAALMPEAARLRDAGHGRVVSYSRKVFIPLTRLCRDACGYCAFARAPRPGARAFLDPEEVIAIARAGREAGCHEALFTLGDKPELRYRVAREELAARGHASTIGYLAAMCERVLRETGLLPHVNPGVMTREDIECLRRVSASQGLMLESTAERLCARGGAHAGAPDKRPSVRLETLRLAGEARVPFTTGILVGIGETRRERIDALVAIRALNERYGHVQEVIVQNFRGKPGTRMSGAPDCPREEHLWTVAAARLILGPDMNIQAPPNLAGPDCADLIAAGVNDWGGVSPVTPDHVNPERPWPSLAALEELTASCGKVLVERLPSYPRYCVDAARWHDPALAVRVTRAADSEGYARADGWSPGLSVEPVLPRPGVTAAPPAPQLAAILEKAGAGEALAEHEIERLFRARGEEIDLVRAAADAARSSRVGDTVRYVVNRNINYTNICAYHCAFCAFSRGTRAGAPRGAPYDLPLEEIERRVEEAWRRGATEVCMQGGIHPSYTGETYLDILRAAKQAAPRIHVHAFTPLEVTHGAQTLGITVTGFLRELIGAGLGSLPGTAAEILDDEVRREICPDKVTADQWLSVMAAAHELGLRSTATIMFGHLEHPRHWARHLARVRSLQARTGGFTEFIPLTFVHMEAPLYRQGRARRGPTAREAVLMHAVSRLALNGAVANIQVSWVKMGAAGARLCLASGANDLGGTLMNESISRAAGTVHGQEFGPAAMDDLIRSASRVPAQRTTLYAAAPAEQVRAAYCAPPLEEALPHGARAAPRRGEPTARAC